MQDEEKKSHWLQRVLGPTSSVKTHPFEFVMMIFSLAAAVKVATEGRFLLTCVFLFVALTCMWKIDRAQSKK
jgi:integral membrane sensor domain MASE1